MTAARAVEMGADTVKRELCIARTAINWWQQQDWITHDPTIGIERRLVSRRLTPRDLASTLADVGCREGPQRNDAIPTQVARMAQTMARLTELAHLGERDITLRELLELSEEELLFLYRGLAPSSTSLRAPGTR